MPSTEEISLIKRRRQALKIWLIENEMTLKELADAAGIKSPTLDAHLNKLTMPEVRHSILVNGFNGLRKPIPAHLLPKGENLPPGPKPKAGYVAAVE